MQQNKLSGSLPREFGGAVKPAWRVVEAFVINSNSFSGKLPLEYRGWGYISVFLAQDNFLEGSLPDEYAVPHRESGFYWEDLVTLDIARNRLSGELPTSFSDLFWLSTFEVSGNQLNGPVRPVGEESNLKFFGAAFNNLSGSIPVDEAGSPTFFPVIMDLRGNLYLHAPVQPVLDPKATCDTLRADPRRPAADALRADPHAFVPQHIFD